MQKITYKNSNPDNEIEDWSVVFQTTKRKLQKFFFGKTNERKRETRER